MDPIGRKQIGAFVFPKALPDEVGFGCPKCDDSRLVKPTAPKEEIAEFLRAFFEKHRPCGDLEVLEKRGNQIMITGRLEKGVF